MLVLEACWGPRTEGVLDFEIRGFSWSQGCLSVSFQRILWVFSGLGFWGLGGFGDLGVWGGGGWPPVRHTLVSTC